MEETKPKRQGFKSKAELGGEIDPKINAAGRPKKDESEPKLTKRHLREKEFMSLLRKIKPHVSKAILTAAQIMQNEKALDSNKLRAAVILLDNYKEMTLGVYDGEDVEGEEVEQIQEQMPTFSLRMVS